MYVDRRFHSAAGVVFSLLTAATMLAQIQPQASDSDKAIIREIKVGEESGAALVRVTGDGVLTLHTERLSGPDRLVLDFANAHLGGVRQAIPGGVGPVRAIRAGQFKPDVARVVVDMESTVPYRIEPGVGSITVVFGAKDIASAQAAPIPKPQAAQVVGTPMMTGAANAPTSPKAARATPTPSLVRASPGILAPSATTTPASL